MNIRKNNLLNIGCGDKFHPYWTNLDYVSSSAEVLSWDLRKGLPFPDNSFDGCYSSHVLEHLTPEEAFRFVAEIFRVLRPGGIVRLVVPDFERMAKDYLEILNRLANGDHSADEDYDWMVIQMIDQSIRKVPGGEMARYWRKVSRKNDKFVIERAGIEAEIVINSTRAGINNKLQRRSLLTRIRSRPLLWYIRTIRNNLARWLVFVIAGEEVANSFKEGLFRNSGEIHHWVYDGYSAARLLTNCGFLKAMRCDATISLIEDFGSYELDVIAGRIRKPDSLFIEASKQD